MSTKIMSSITEEKRDLRKQIGCMTGIFHHFITGRRIISSSHNQKRLLLAAQDQLEPQHFIEDDLEPQKERPRNSIESPRASYSSSTSTFSSLDSPRTARPEKLPAKQIKIPESLFQMNTIKEERLPPTNSTQSNDFRDVVKESMYRETWGLSIKSVANVERNGQAMKHIDSPRPLMPKATGYEGSTRVLGKDERLALPRFSYDGRESRDAFKSDMKLKELPRLSLDSRASSMKSSAPESRLNFLSTNQEPESRPRSSVVVAKLMGLDTFPDTISTNERTPKINSSIATQKTERNHKNNKASPSPRLQNNSSMRKLSSPTKRATFPTEPAPWRQKDSTKSSQKMSPQSKKASNDVRPLSSSVYGEIEKRITQLEFRKSGKDLRALKQILEAMQKTRERMESEIGESAEFTLQKSNHQVPTFRRPTKLSSSIVVMKPAKVMDIKVSSSMKVPATEITHLQKLQSWDHRKDVHIQKAKDVTPRNNNLKDQKKIFPRNSELDRTSRESQRVKVENCSTYGRNAGMVSPRLQKSLIRVEDKFQCTITTLDSNRVKRQSSKKLEEQGSQSRLHKVKAKNPQLTDDQLSEFTSDAKYSSYQDDTASTKSESNNSLASQIETDVHSTSRNGRNQNSVSTSREDMPSVELVVTMTEQPSPVSVLNAAFYNEDSLSPVKKISTAFQVTDEIPSPHEAEWHPESLNHVMVSKGSNHGYEFNQKLENMKNLLCEYRLSNTEPGETAVTHNDVSLNPDHGYINMILQASGLLKDTSFISTTDQLFSPCHMISPEMFHVLEQIESVIEGANKEVIGKDDQNKFNQKKGQRKIVFDMVNEILCGKVTSGRLFTLARKQTSPHVLLKEIHLEINRLHKMPDCNLEDEDDGFITLLTADMTYQSEDWAEYSGEVPAMILNIERLIFKDLINEIVTSEVIGFTERPNSHCRKLFTK